MISAIAQRLLTRPDTISLSRDKVIGEHGYDFEYEMCRLKMFIHDAMQYGLLLEVNEVVSPDGSLYT